MRTLPEVQDFYVIRAPRDLSVSAYFSHRYSHTLEYWSTLVEHRKRLQQVSKEGGRPFAAPGRNYNDVLVKLGYEQGDRW